MAQGLTECDHVWQGGWPRKQLELTVRECIKCKSKQWLVVKTEEHWSSEEPPRSYLLVLNKKVI